MRHHKKLKNEELNRPDIESFKNQKKLPVTLVLDNVRSLNNIGSVFRSSDAMGIERIVLCGISATPPHPEIYKTALGAENSVEWQYFPTTVDAINHLKEDGYQIAAFEQAVGSIDLTEFSPGDGIKYAFIFGNELKGVSQEAIDLCDMVIEIPQFGTKHSFNIAVTAGIVLWDFFSKKHNNKKGD